MVINNDSGGGKITVWTQQRRSISQAASGKYWDIFAFVVEGNIMIKQCSGTCSSGSGPAGFWLMNANRGIVYTDPRAQGGSEYALTTDFILIPYNGALYANTHYSSKYDNGGNMSVVVTYFSFSLA